MLTKKQLVDKIHCGDCIELMNKMPKSSIDIIITSPPYNIGVDYGKYNDNLSFEDYLKLMNNFGKACSRILKDDGSLFFNIGDKANDEFRSFLAAQSVKGDCLKVQNTFHWVKSIAVPEHDVNIGHFKPVNSGRYVNNCHEYIFHFTKTGSVQIDKLGLGVPYADKSNINRWGHTNGHDLRDRGNQWFIPYKTVQSKKDHPAAFPERLPEMCISISKHDSKTIVLDPFCGSGNTCIAAQKLGCHYIGIDIDEVYVKMTQNKLVTLEQFA